MVHDLTQRHEWDDDKNEALCTELTDGIEAFIDEQITPLLEELRQMGCTVALGVSLYDPLTDYSARITRMKGDNYAQAGLISMMLAEKDNR